MRPKTKKVSSTSDKETTLAPVPQMRTAKKTVAKKSSEGKKRASKKKVTRKPVHPSAPEPVELHHRYIFIGACRHCEHMPMEVTRLVAVLCVAIAVLSGLVISTSQPLTFELPSLSMDSLTNWITPTSHVKSL